MASTTKDRIIDSSAELFRRQGYTGTGVKQIVAAANAPFGSLYHFFPGGKQQLGAEAIRSSGRLYIELFATIAAQAPDVTTAVGDFFAGAAETLRETGYADACPIATVALEVASTNEPLREATAEVFDSWIAGTTEYFVAANIPRDTARELAFSMLSLLEGAFVFCRAMRTTEPLEVAGASAVAAVQAALAASSSTESAAPGIRPDVPEWTIRSAVEQDVEPVLSLWYAAGSPPSVTDTREGLLRLLATDKEALLIAHVGGILAGSLIAAWDGWRGSFYRLAVDPDRRRQGIATALLREGERHLRARGAVRLTAIVAEDDPTAMSFWQAAGYTRQRDRARFVRLVED